MDATLKPLKPLLGKWEFTGSFKDDKNKKVKGWESYELSNDGKTIAEAWEVFTIWPDREEVNRGKMKIRYDDTKKAFLASAKNDGPDYTISVKNDGLVIENETYRFTGKFSDDSNTIKGKWEEADGKGGWDYWYDKVLHKVEA